MWFNVLALILVNVIQNNEKRILTHYILIIYIYIYYIDVIFYTETWESNKNNN